MSGTRYLCVHGHFYQPPRENPWLEAIERQDSARPFHDWNERIAAECYGPNAFARVLENDRIVDVTNNYARMSFNFGPTLLSWLEEHAPEVHAAILEADRESALRFSGHGSAMAQVYNHMILPLATPRDRKTQVLWGIRDFEHRYGRKPEGMWLAETAADLESLDLLAQQGIQFTVLAPRQARRARKRGGRLWREVPGEAVDPSVAYRVMLPAGRSIAVFFYDGPVSRAVAFERLLDDGRVFADRLRGAFSSTRDGAQLVHVATDGESYGHHHRHGEMALAYALRLLGEDPEVRLTNYAEFLSLHPPSWVAEIHDRSSWSCVHGVERWWSDCGCSSGMHPGWGQHWRTPLRDALDWLRDALEGPWETEAGKLFPRPWDARDAYIEVILDRSPEHVDRWIDRHAGRRLDPVERVRALKLLELQRHAMLMYTSCGWFFDELSGIETVQVIQYAGRAVQLAAEALSWDPEPEFLDRLARARSNLAEHGNGAAIYRKWVKPAAVDLRKVAAHYAISTLFEDYAERSRLYAWDVVREDDRDLRAGRQQLRAGRARFTSRVTGESATISYGVLHLGDHNLQAGVRDYRGPGALDATWREASEAFDRGESSEVVRLLDREFGGTAYSIRSLFRDEQRRVLSVVLASTLEEAEADLRRIHRHYEPLVRFLTDLGNPVPPVLHAASRFVIHSDLRKLVRQPEPDADAVARLLDTAARDGVGVEDSNAAWILAASIAEWLRRLSRDAEGEPADLARLEALVSIARRRPLAADLSDAQNVYWRMRGDPRPAAAARAFASLGRSLGFEAE